MRASSSSREMANARMSRSLRLLKVRMVCSLAATMTGDAAQGGAGHELKLHIRPTTARPRRHKTPGGSGALCRNGRAFLSQQEKRNRQREDERRQHGQLHDKLLFSG